MIFAMAMLALPATALAQYDDDGKSAVKKVTAKWQAAYNAGDGAAIAALYSNDAVLHPPNSAPVTGAEAIEAFWTQGASQGASTELTTKELYSMGDMAVEVGMYSGTNADGSHDDHGHFTVIYKKVDGKWMMFRDMWNSDMSQ
jgi:uncharacterized protein (TIGR02246 family)